MKSEVSMTNLVKYRVDTLVYSTLCILRAEGAIDTSGHAGLDKSCNERLSSRPRNILYPQAPTEGWKKPM